MLNDEIEKNNKKHLKKNQLVLTFKTLDCGHEIGIDHVEGKLIKTTKQNS
jgi:hypothetical protein